MKGIDRVDMCMLYGCIVVPSCSSGLNTACHWQSSINFAMVLCFYGHWVYGLHPRVGPNVR